MSMGVRAGGGGGRTSVGLPGAELQQGWGQGREGVEKWGWGLGWPGVNSGGWGRGAGAWLGLGAQGWGRLTRHGLRAGGG